MEAVLGFFIGLASSIVGSIATGGGLISIPALIFLGLSPASAIATTRITAVSAALTAIFKYRNKNVFEWRIAVPLIVMSVFSAVIGTQILLNINDELLSTLVGIILLILLPIVVFKKDLGVEAKKRHKKHEITGYVLMFLIMIYGALFGGGSGIFMMYVMVYFFGLKFINSIATITVSWLFLSSIALVIYMFAGLVDYTYGLGLIFGGLLGGYIGSHLALKKGNEWVRLVFIVVIVASSIKLLFF